MLLKRTAHLLIRTVFVMFYRAGANKDICTVERGNRVSMTQLGKKKGHKHDAHVFPAGTITIWEMGEEPLFVGQGRHSWSLVHYKKHSQFLYDETYTCSVTRVAIFRHHSTVLCVFLRMTQEMASTASLYVHSDYI